MEKFVKLVDSGDLVVFSKEEADALKRVASWVRAGETVGKIGGGLMSFAKWFVVIGGAYALFKAGLKDWLERLLS